MAKKLTSKKLDAYIAERYQVLADRQEINVLDIGKVMRAARTEYDASSDLARVDATLKEQIAKFCKPSGSL